MINFVEKEKIKNLTRRQALRDAIAALEKVEQANKGERVLIRRKDAIRAISSLTCNGLGWGGVHDEVGPDPRSDK